MLAPPPIEGDQVGPAERQRVAALDHERHGFAPAVEQRNGLEVGDDVTCEALRHAGYVPLLEEPRDLGEEPRVVDGFPAITAPVEKLVSVVPQDGFALADVGRFDQVMVIVKGEIPRVELIALALDLSAGQLPDVLHQLGVISPGDTQLVQTVVDPLGSGLRHLGVPQTRGLDRGPHRPLMGRHVGGIDHGGKHGAEDVVVGVAADGDRVGQRQLPHEVEDQSPRLVGPRVQLTELEVITPSDKSAS
jgi:hypothetical protein